MLLEPHHPQQAFLKWDYYLQH